MTRRQKKKKKTERDQLNSEGQKNVKQRTFIYKTHIIWNLSGRFLNNSVHGFISQAYWIALNLRINLNGHKIKEGRDNESNKGVHI